MTEISQFNRLDVDILDLTCSEIISEIRCPEMDRLLIIISNNAEILYQYLLTRFYICENWREVT